MREVNASRRKSIDDYEVKRKVGRGAYGDVYLAESKCDLRPYAIKMIQKSRLKKQKKQYQAHIQKEVLFKLRHPGIIQMKATFHDHKILYFVLEYCQGGCFTDYIHLNIKQFTQQMRVYYIAQIVNTLEYLHTNGITHRDLKPENILVNKQGKLILIDFGTADINNCKLISQEFKKRIQKMKKQEEEQQKIEGQLQMQRAVSTPEISSQEEIPQRRQRRSTFVGSRNYIAPQLLQKNYCPPSADLWALGCILYQLYYFDTPFQDFYQFGVFEKIKKAQVQFPQNSLITLQAIDLIKKLLVKDPNGRLGSCSCAQLNFSTLKQHSFFKGIKVDTIYSVNPPRFKEQNHKQEEIFAKKQCKDVNIINNCDQEVIIKGNIQKKGIVSYTTYYIVIKKGLSLIRIKKQDQNKRKNQQISIGELPPAKQIDPMKFSLQTTEKQYIFKTEAAEEWVQAINKQYKSIKAFKLS